MIFDFSFILVVATLATGLIWAADAWVLKPQRVHDAGGDATAAREPVVVEYARSFFPIILIVLVIRSFLFEPFRIPSDSMMPTLLDGDFIFVNKFTYGLRLPVVNAEIVALGEPQRGDVVVFRLPSDPSTNYIKRLVGLPGDTVEMRLGKLIRNGTLVSEGYVEHTEPDMDPSPEDFKWQKDYLVRTAAAATGYHPSRNNWGPLVVPKGNYFVLGDNRDNSLDSRYWGWVADSLVKGRPFVIYYSYSPDSVDTFAWLTHIRWTRLGERIR